MKRRTPMALVEPQQYYGKRRNGKLRSGTSYSVQLSARGMIRIFDDETMVALLIYDLLSTEDQIEYAELMYALVMYSMKFQEGWI